MNFKRIKTITVRAIVILIAIVIGGVVMMVIEHEIRKRELTFKQPIAVPYDGSVEDLFLTPKSYDVNDYVYTLIKDDKVDELYNILHEAERKTYVPSELWLIYDLAVNEQYCMTKQIDEVCYISENEIKTNIVKIGESGRTYNFYNTAQVESSVNGITTYSTALSDRFLQAVDNAYVISQGADADGYDEAMKASYDIAVENGYLGKYELFATDYTNELRAYQTKLETFKDMSLEEVIANYSEYAKIIAIIERNLDIIDLGIIKYRPMYMRKEEI